MPEKEIIGLRAAARFADVTPEAMRKWCERYPIARRVGRKWVINKAALSRIVKARKILGIKR